MSLIVVGIVALIAVAIVGAAALWITVRLLCL
jgi:hypothetical protein